MNSENTIYHFSANTLDGQVIDFEHLRGKVLLIVNVASQCGFTKQYQDLQNLYQTYSAQGFEVLGFPCNQFGGQEPGTANDILTFCSNEFNVSFPLFEKIDVNGPNAHALYQWLKAQQPGVLGTQDIKWNFTKFLISRQGTVIDRYAPATTPKSIEKDILAALNA